MTIVYLYKSDRAGKKYMADVDGKRVHFGADGYSDYTKHRDPERMQRYLARHKARENWTKSGMRTAGFWSRWILWNKPTLKESIRDTERRFNIRIYKK